MHGSFSRAKSAELKAWTMLVIQNFADVGILILDVEKVILNTNSQKEQPV